jgi:hypothetical protein
MLHNPEGTNVTYAIRQLQDMGSFNDPFRGTGDFSLTEVLAAVHGLMQHPDPEVARSAIRVVGSGNPYLSDERTPYWLATVGSADVPGLGKMPRDLKNPGGQTYWGELISIANQKLPPATRALAIRALGLASEPAVQPAIENWVKDPEPLVRASATVLLADFPTAQTSQSLEAIAADRAPEVRSSVAQSIGFAQKAELAPVLGTLLVDKDKSVRRDAAMSLLSFSATNTAIASVFTANIDNKEFYPLFLNVLARQNPGAYLDKLDRAVQTNAAPENWWGGEIPAFTSWKILFKYLQSQSEKTLRSGEFDHHLDAMEKVGNYSSSEPRDIYAFYLQRGMTKRAKRFREEANRKATYDLDYYFKQVDKSPGTYTRQ